MTREELFRAVGEVREDQLLEAEQMPEPRSRDTRKNSWERWLAAAACLTLLVCTTVSQMVPAYGMVGQPESAAGADADDVDGGESSGPGTENAPPYSVNAEIGEVDPAPEARQDSTACLAWLEPEELLAEDTEIFRGTVQTLRGYAVTVDGHTQTYTVAAVTVTDVIRGQAAPGETRRVLYSTGSSISGSLETLAAGSEAIFLPRRATAETGWRNGEDYFCYADLADCYFQEGVRFLFLDTGAGLDFARDVYTEIADAETLDQVAAYLRRMTAGTGQPSPSVTEESGTGTGAGGAKELPGGAMIGE